MIEKSDEEWSQTSVTQKKNVKLHHLFSVVVHIADCGRCKVHFFLTLWAVHNPHATDWQPVRDGVQNLSVGVSNLLETET